MNNSKAGLLPQVTFGILFALSAKPLYGYALIQQIRHDSTGKVKLGPGALYGTLKRLADQGYIEELPFEEASERRRYYRLTRKGWNALSDELEYYENITRLGQERGLLHGGTITSRL
ncbi:MAG: PadR family transcriptional regulator [Candidatus Saccharibacteria bacterium]